jgi:hypothetical protein
MAQGWTSNYPTVSRSGVAFVEKGGNTFSLASLVPELFGLSYETVMNDSTHRAITRGEQRESEVSRRSWCISGSSQRFMF